MKFEIGQPIKIQVSDRWLCGTFLDEVPGNKAMVEFRGKKQIWDASKIKKHIKLDRNPDGSCPGLDEFEKTHWDSLKSVVSLGVAQLLGPNPPSIEIDEDEKMISIDSGWISIHSGTVERVSIIGFVEHPTWCVSMAVSSAGSYWEPPDVDIVEVGEKSNVVAAAELFVSTYWIEKNKSFWDNADIYHGQDQF